MPSLPARSAHSATEAFPYLSLQTTSVLDSNGIELQNEQTIFPSLVEVAWDHILCEPQAVSDEILWAYRHAIDGYQGDESGYAYLRNPKLDHLAGWLDKQRERLVELRSKTRVILTTQYADEVYAFVEKQHDHQKDPVIAFTTKLLSLLEDAGSQEEQQHILTFATFCAWHEIAHLIPRWRFGLEWRTPANRRGQRDSRAELDPDTQELLGEGGEVLEDGLLGVRLRLNFRPRLAEIATDSQKPGLTAPLGSSSPESSREKVNPNLQDYGYRIVRTRDEHSLQDEAILALFTAIFTRTDSENGQPPLLVPTLRSLKDEASYSPTCSIKKDTITNVRRELRGMDRSAKPRAQLANFSSWAPKREVVPPTDLPNDVEGYPRNANIAALSHLSSWPTATPSPCSRRQARQEESGDSNISEAHPQSLFAVLVREQSLESTRAARHSLEGLDSLRLDGHKLDTAASHVPSGSPSTTPAEIEVDEYYAWQLRYAELHPPPPTLCTTSHERIPIIWEAYQRRRKELHAQWLAEESARLHKDEESGNARRAHL